MVRMVCLAPLGLFRGLWRNLRRDEEIAATLVFPIVAALRNGTALPTERADPIGNMATIDAIYAKAGFKR